MLERARLKTITKLLCAALLVGGLLVSQQASAAEDPKWPGLPLGAICSNGLPCQYTGAATSGISETKRAKQWARIPSVVYAANVETVYSGNDSTCTLDPGFQTLSHSVNRLYAISPEGSPKKYGYFPPFTVKTVAFGAIPVEATLQISHLRDDEDLPLPLVSVADSKAYCQVGGGRKGNLYLDAVVSGSLEVRLSRMTVDGVPIEVGSKCMTGPAEIALKGRGFWDRDPSIPVTDRPPISPTTNYYTVILGGLLTGTLDIPAFSGCRSGTGDDISPLLTSAVSGPGNPLTVRQSAISAKCFDPTKIGVCKVPPELPYPPRDDN